MTRPSKLSEEKIWNGKEAIRKDRARTDFCTYCPANHCENSHGSKSLWGRKVASKTLYRTGKGRKNIDWSRRRRNHHYYWDLMDKHYCD